MRDRDENPAAASGAVRAGAGRAEMLRRAIRLKKAAAREREVAGSRSPAEAGIGRRPAGREARLGELQRSLWLEHRLDPGSAAYNLASAFRVRGSLDAAVLERAFERVVARHRLLRSTFRAEGDGALQIVGARGAAALERFEAPAGELVAVATREARRPFRLEHGPLVRLVLVEEPSGEALLVLALHHILADERSLALLWKELAEGMAGRLPAEVEGPQYDDWVDWQARREQRSPELDHWRRRLDPLPGELQWPFERPSGSAPEPARGRLLVRPLEPGARRGIRRVAAAAGTTPFAVYAFLFRLLLHRYTAGRDVAFATPVSQRSHPDTLEMIGYFLNPVVIRAEIREERSVAGEVQAFSRRLREDLARASLPFDVLVEELSPPRRRGRHLLFQAMFVYQEAPPVPGLGDGARLEPVTLDLGESKFDLTFFVSELAAGDEEPVELAVEYRADRFDEVWMRRLLAHFERLVEGLDGDLERPVAGVSMLSRAEHDEIVRYATGAAPALASPDLLPRQILDRCRRSPSEPAVVGAEATWTYGELELASRHIAGELRRQGVEPGDRVGLFLDRGPGLIAGLLGCHWAGAAYVPLDPGYPPARNLDVLEDAEVAAVVTRGALREGLPAGSWPAVEVDGLERTDGEDGLREIVEVEGEHPAYLLYTSGSTGRPKGVVITHANLRASNGVRPQVYGSPSAGNEGSGMRMRFLLLPSIAFDSSVVGIFWTLAEGGALVVPSDGEARDPRALARRVLRDGVTHLLCVPSLYAHLLEAGGEELGRSLGTVIVAGESCPPRLVRRHFEVLPETRLFNEYGPTEATVWATVDELGPADGEAGPVPIGRPIPGVRVEVLDAHGRRVPAGVPGEAWIAGPTVARGYRHRPELSRGRFVRREVDGEAGERTYRTGDLLAWRLDGRLDFLGRVDEQIKLRGFRVEPGEIEALLVDLAGVEGAAVVARDAQLVAFVTPGGDVAGLRSGLAARLPEHMVPSRVVGLDELPRLPNGKVDRCRLREMPLEPVAPAGRDGELEGRERDLATLWEGLFGRPDVGPDDNFFELGGHSLRVVEMTTILERDFGVILAPAEVFAAPTVRELARRLRRQDDEAGREGSGGPVYEHLFPIQPGGRGAPILFCVPHFFTRPFADHFRGERPVYGLRGVSLRPGGNRGRWRTMGELGDELADEIERRFPNRSGSLFGYSFGATMAIEAARRLEERGRPARRLVLIAPMPLDVYRLGPLRFQLDGLRGPVSELSPMEALGRYARAHHPFSRRLYQRAWRRLAIEPWRRLLCFAGRLRTLAGLPLTPGILHADVRVERFRLHAGYRPGAVHTPTVFFNAREPETDAAATWRPFFGGPFTVHPIPDPHLGEAAMRAATAEIFRHLEESGDPGA